ncbi:MAG TPA: STAS domain-containing protein, partial [Acidimicrobiia bacterium]|nr:STAS domain-containing protein [Acidimicrobiia bacterium]
MTNELGVDITTREPGRTLSLNGEIDFGNVAQLRGALMELANEGLEPIVIDMAGVTFVDSTALSVL